MLSGVNGASPWAANASESAFYLVETALGRYSSSLLVEWVPSVESCETRAASSVPDHTNVWTDGSLVLDQVTGVSSSGAVCLMVVMALFHLSLFGTVIFFFLFSGFFVLGVWIRFGSSRLKVMLMIVWFLMVGCGASTGWVTMLLMRLLASAEERLVMMSSTLVVLCLGFVVAGTLSLHRFFIAISWAVVNHDGREGLAPDPLVWSAGALPKRRRLVHAVRDRAFLPGPPGIWDSEWV